MGDMVMVEVTTVATVALSLHNTAMTMATVMAIVDMAMAADMVIIAATTIYKEKETMMATAMDMGMAAVTVATATVVATVVATVRIMVTMATVDTQNTVIK